MDNWWLLIPISALAGLILVLACTIRLGMVAGWKGLFPPTAWFWAVGSPEKGLKLVAGQALGILLMAPSGYILYLMSQWHGLGGM
jgi:hypothetical protein